MLMMAIRRALFAAFLLTAGSGTLLAQPTSVRSVRLAPDGPATAVIVEANGVLPVPHVGVLADPPRIYLDLRGVTPATSGMVAEGHAVVRGVRVALNQPQPPVTRVVIDLTTPTPHRVDTALRQRGQLRVLVGASPASAAAPRETNWDPPKSATALPQGQPAAPPVTPPTPAPLPAQPGAALPAQPGAAAASPVAAPPPQAPRTVTPQGAGAPAPPASAAQPPRSQPSEASSRESVFSAFASNARASATSLPPKDVEKYLRKAAPAIERLEKARPLLTSLDALASVPDDTLQQAIGEFESIRRALAAIEPPRKLEATHELLIKACMLGTSAATARSDPAVAETTRAWSAASAAAGALMLVERARADLGLGPRSGR